VHGLEREWGDRVQFFHVNFRSPAGKELGRRYEIEHLPALLLLDGGGKVQANLSMGLHLREEVKSRLTRLIEGGNRE
jgi:hypothetical protein